MSDLHGQIMNLPCQPREVDAGGDAWMSGYRYGHRDARHAAAELACLAKAADALNTPKHTPKPTASADSPAITMARQYLAKLPVTIDDPALHEVVAHLSGVLAALDEVKPAGHVVTWNKGGSGEHNSIEPIGKLGYSLAESLPDGTLIYLAPPASSNLLAAARHYASSYLQQERDDAKLCCDAKHHADVCALFAAIEREGEGGAAIPDVLFDGNAVYAEVMATTPCATRTSPENVSEVLDAVVRLLRAPSAIAATKEGA